MAIKGLLFDKDGTLIDVTGTWVPTYHEVLAELFGRDAEKIEAMLVAAGYDPAKGQFTSGSVLAGGTTRDLISVWWPDLDQAGILEKLHLLDVEYRDVALKHLKPLMPLDPILSSLRDRGTEAWRRDERHPILGDQPSCRTRGGVLLRCRHRRRHCCCGEAFRRHGAEVLRDHQTRYQRDRDGRR